MLPGTRQSVAHKKRVAYWEFYGLFLVRNPAGMDLSAHCHLRIGGPRDCTIAQAATASTDPLSLLFNFSPIFVPMAQRKLCLLYKSLIFGGYEFAQARPRSPEQSRISVEKIVMSMVRRQSVMNNIGMLPETETREGVRRGAMSIADFCRRYGIGRTTAYEQIKAGALRARKCGKRTIISDADAEEFLHHLPTMAAAITAL